MKNLTIKISNTIYNTMKLLDKTAEKCLFVIDNSSRLIGTVTDGDLRRAILNGNSLNDKIKNCYNADPIYLNEEDSTSKEIKKQLIENRIEIIPIINKKRQIVNYTTWEQAFGDRGSYPINEIDAEVVIMAGGKGTRLKPFTDILPKPLIPVNGKPIIEHIIDNFSKYFISSYFVSVNYKSEILKAYFIDKNPEYEIKFVEEKIPLGTSGGLRLIKKPINKTLIVCNCDTIIKSDMGDILEFHKRNQSDITIVASAKKFKMPFGACMLDDLGNLDYIKEKPEFDFLVNTGLYILEPKILKIIPSDSLYHFTDLVKDAKKSEYKIGVYPISPDSWIDVGQWAEFHEATKLL